MLYSKLFENNNDYAAYTADTENFILPNVSYCVSENEVHMSPYIPPPPSKTPIDLGLPSGLKWAQANIGADSETEDGLYFAWGEITGYANAAARNAALGRTGGFDQASYDAGSAASISANLTSSNDAATVNLGGSWHMPTKSEFEELINSSNTDSEWTTINGVSGYKFMKKSDHNVYVFFPASGYWNGTSQRNHGLLGYCWLSTFYDSTNAYNLNFSSGSVSTSSNYRRFGFTVRAVTI